MAAAVPSLLVKLGVLVIVMAVHPAASVQLTCPSDPMEGDRVTYEWSVGDGDVTSQNKREKFFYDPKKKMVAVKGDWSSTTGQYATWWIYDFPHQILYTIKGDKCVTSALSGSFQFAGCMPVDRRYGVMNSFIGVNAFQEQMVVLEEFVYNSTGRVYSSWEFFQRPLLEHIFGVRDGYLLLTTIHYQNIVKNVTDPSIFVPPAICRTEMAGTQTARNRLSVSGLLRSDKRDWSLM